MSQIEIKESIVELRDSIARVETIIERKAEAIARLKQAVKGVVNVETVQQDSLEGIDHTIDSLNKRDANDSLLPIPKLAEQSSKTCSYQIVSNS
ncbi:MAG: hypothetical protein AAGB01_05455 [Cyanobacteria bacterium P01_F01_bin.42]